MRTVRVGGRTYSDPDVLSLIGATGELVDPRWSMLTSAQRLNDRYRSLGGDNQDPWQRMQILASLSGLVIKPMTVGTRQQEDRDAVLLPPKDGQAGQILFNPQRPRPRVVFSIAHEISHTFFPNSTQGARFRTICDPTSSEANELERLCDLGASELLMPHDEFRAAIKGQYLLERIPELLAQFGSSYEATLFRLATVHPKVAIAGLARYRCRKGDQLTATDEVTLFGRRPSTRKPPEFKYRRQSFFSSASSAQKMLVPWNKSFEPNSCIARAASTGNIERGRELLPCLQPWIGHMQAMRAPYQRDDAHPEYPDVLFFWEASDITH